jgi:hypothetical protein
MPQQQLTRAVENLASLGCRQQPPLPIGCPSRLHRAIYVRFARGLKLSHYIVDIGWIVIEKSLAALCAHPLAANQVLIDLRRHCVPFVEPQRITQANRRCCIRALERSVKTGRMP